MAISSLEDIFILCSNESMLLGGDGNVHIINIIAVVFTMLFYFIYYVIAKHIRRKTIIRNPEIEELAYKKGAITNDQLMVKYTANLSASSTMAALSVTMVLLSVASLFEKELNPYNNFIAIAVCTLMTIASIALLFAHELYDAIINPVFDVQQKFRLRRLGSDFQALGLVMFIISMLLAISTVSTLATILSSLVCCIIMSTYIEKRLIHGDGKSTVINQIIKHHKRKL